MQKSNAEILNHFYGLLLEMNFNRPDEDVFVDKDYREDPFISKHLQRIKLQSAKYKIHLNKNRYTAILEEIRRLKDIGIEELKKIVNPQEAAQLQPLFRRFDELSKRDEASIAEDQELLQLISAIKGKIDKTNPDE